MSPHKESPDERIENSGFPRLNELLGLIKEVGGVKKFKDLLEAMSAPEVDDIKF